MHEIKFDGYRLQVHRQPNVTRCFTRCGHDWVAKFPTVVSAAAHLQAQSFVLDGEAVIVTDQGDTDFNELESYVAPKGALKRVPNGRDGLERDTILPRCGRWTIRYAIC